MEHWQSASILTERTTEVQRRALATTTGNVQSYAYTCKDGIENHDSMLQSQHLTSKPEAHYSTTIPTLGSNDLPQDSLRRLQARRRRRENGRQGPDLSRPYLDHPKYLNYRARPRRDTGDDGKAKWDDRMEEAFQNGELHV